MKYSKIKISEAINIANLKIDAFDTDLLLSFVKKVNRDSVFSNYQTLIDSINQSSNDIKYDNYFLDFLKQETSTTCDLSKDGIVMRGNFRAKHIQNLSLIHI